MCTNRNRRNELETGDVGGWDRCCNLRRQSTDQNTKENRVINHSNERRMNRMNGTRQRRRFVAAVIVIAIVFAVVILKTTSLSSLSIRTFDKAPATYHSGEAVLLPLEKGDPYSPTEREVISKRWRRTFSSLSWRSSDLSPGRWSDRCSIANTSPPGGDVLRDKSKWRVFTLCDTKLSFETRLKRVEN